MDMNQDKNYSGGLRWILKHTKPQLINIILLAVVYSILAIIGVYTALLAKGVIDGAVSRKMDDVVFYGAVYAAVILGQLLLRVFSRTLFFRTGTKLSMHYRRVVFNSVLKKDYFSVSAFHSGELLNRMTSDVNLVADTVLSILPSLAFMVTKLVGVLVVLLSIDWRFTLIFIVGAAVVYIVTRIFRKSMKSLHKKVQESDGKVMSFIQEILSSMLVVKVFGAEDKTAEKCENLQHDSYMIKRKRNFISVLANTGFSFVFAGGYLYGLLWGATNIISGVITYGTLTAVLSLISQIQAPISDLSGILPKYYGAVASAERLMELEHLKDEKESDQTPLDVKELYQNLEAIQFEHISFRYDRNIVLQDTGVTINKEDFMVIMGISGIGKSTLIKLLLGVYPLTQGSIYLLLKNGEKIHIDKNTRKLFAYVPQGNFLFSGTIWENITFVHGTATAEEVNQAVKLACADTFIKELPKGLDTVIGEKGLGLSEGQVQRIAIARALLGQAPILLLDEATSALDEETEKQVLENIRGLRNKTCIIISHKNAAISVCNRHIQIIDGRIVEERVCNG